MNQEPQQLGGHGHINPTYYELRLKIFDELRSLGITGWGLYKTEAQYLPTVIHPDEKLLGAVYGRNRYGLLLLVATEWRVLCIDTKPLFTKVDDISYDTITGITLEWVAFSGILVLHAQSGEVRIRVYNKKAAHTLVEYIERRSIEHRTGRYPNMTKEKTKPDNSSQAQPYIR